MTQVQLATWLGDIRQKVRRRAVSSSIIKLRIEAGSKAEMRRMDRMAVWYNTRKTFIDEVVVGRRRWTKSPQ